jgi:effector-binding domain-containing protein
MGSDFTGVRVHTDTQADGLNQALSARAFTTGHHIFFRQGHYQPQTRSGQELIAHELTHVVQQQGNSTAQRHNPQLNPVIQRYVTEKQEDPNQMYALYKRKYKKLGSTTMFLVNSPEDKTVKKNRLGFRVTKNIDRTRRLQILESVTNPNGVPAGDYYLVTFMEPHVDQNQADKIDLKQFYGYVLKSEVKALASHEKIAKIGTDIEHPKQGKILPVEDEPPISQQDVYQSAISDCYLHAALIAIVHANPLLIHRLFTRIEDENLDITFPGYYNPVSQFPNPLKVTLQKKLFLTPDGKPLYGGKKDSYLWPAFVQKAWAVYRGKYSNLPMGTPIDIMEKITGEQASATEVRHASDKKADKAWELYTKIAAALNNHKPVTIATNTWTDRKPKRFGGFERVMPSKADHGGLGIIHGYAVLRVSDSAQKRPEQDPDALPTGITLILRDPRTESGDTFELSLEKLLDQRKVLYVFIGGDISEEISSDE